MPGRCSGYPHAEEPENDTLPSDIDRAQQRHLDLTTTNSVDSKVLPTILLASACYADANSPLLCSFEVLVAIRNLNIKKWIPIFKFLRVDQLYADAMRLMYRPANQNYCAHSDNCQKSVCIEQANQNKNSFVVAVQHTRTHRRPHSNSRTPLITVNVPYFDHRLFLVANVGANDGNAILFCRLVNSHILFFFLSNNI